MACSGVHLGLAVGLVQAWGAVGLIIADSANMAMRVAYCLRFIRAHFAGVRGHSLRCVAQSVVGCCFDVLDALVSRCSVISLNQP